VDGVAGVSAQGGPSHGNPSGGYFGLLTSDYHAHPANLTVNVINFVYGTVKFPFGFSYVLNEPVQFGFGASSPDPLTRIPADSESEDRPTG
jgi:hypothetical protein